MCCLDSQLEDNVSLYVDCLRSKAKNEAFPPEMDPSSEVECQALFDELYDLGKLRQSVISLGFN